MLHGANQHFGLIPVSDVFLLCFRYILIAVATGFFAHILFKDRKKAFVFSFFLLLIFFLFGAIKSSLAKFHFIASLTPYKYFLPLLFLVFILIFTLLKRSATNYTRIFHYLKILTLALVGFEVISLGVNALLNSAPNEFGDVKHQLISGKKIETTEKPDIFWIVLDEYAATSTLKAKWGFANPLDSLLSATGYFVADKATSPYNFTHYSVGATLDMDYYHRLDKRQSVSYADMVRGDKSISENNVTAYLQRNGYAVHNYSLFNMKGNPTHPFNLFKSEPSRLISSTTFTSRVQEDILWQFPNLFSYNKKLEDSLDQRMRFQDAADRQQFLINLFNKVADSAAKDSRPGFYIFHYMITHEPFLFNEDGSLHDHPSYTQPDAYVSSVVYANQVLERITQRIRSRFSKRSHVVVVQSDHGFKFDEEGADFLRESNKIFYAVYASDGDYAPWTNDVNSVNTFRIIFDKYFNAGFPLLPSHNFVLRYQQ